MFWTEFVSGRLIGESPTGKHIDNQMTFGEQGDPEDEDGWKRTKSTHYSTYRGFRSRLERTSLEDINRVVNSAGSQ